MGALRDLSPKGNIVIGILVGLLSTIVQSIGLTLQRKSHLLELEEHPYDSRRPPYRRRRWQLGMALFITSNLVGSTIQITTLPLPVLSTLQASGLVFNSICATSILGEPFTHWSLGGTILVSSGAVLIAIFGAIPEPAHSLDQLLLLLSRRNFIFWMIFQILLVAGIIILAGFLSYLPGISSSPRVRLVRGLAYGGISGILSAHSLLVAKSAVELLVCSLVDGMNQFNHWQSWTILLSLVFLALTQLYYLHRGLKLISTSVLYPLVFCVYNIVAIFDGLIYFKQTDRLRPLHAGLIALGTVILLSGVLALSWRLSDDQSQPPLAKSALTPGLGFIEDTDNDEYLDSSDTNEEAASSAERQPLLSRGSVSPLLTLDSAERDIHPSHRLVQFSDRNELHISGETSDLDGSGIAPSKSCKLSVNAVQIPDHHEGARLLSSAGRQKRRVSRLSGFVSRSTSKSKRKKIYPEVAGGEFWKMKWLGGLKLNGFKREEELLLDSGQSSNEIGNIEIFDEENYATRT